jgi:hypothetical protein
MSLACAWIFILIAYFLTMWVSEPRFFRPLSRTPPGSINHSDIVQEAWANASVFVLITWIDLIIATSLNWPEVMWAPWAFIALVFLGGGVLAFFAALCPESNGGYD